MVDTRNFAALDEMLDQLTAKPHDAWSYPKVGQLRGLVVTPSPKSATIDFEDAANFCSRHQRLRWKNVFALHSSKSRLHRSLLTAALMETVPQEKSYAVGGQPEDCPTRFFA
jgi:hypothetical protein